MTALAGDAAGLSRRVREAARRAGLPDRLAAEVARYAGPPLPAAPPRADALTADEPVGPVLVACDLDRTLIYSAAALGLTGEDADAPSMVVTEVYEGAPASFLTRDAALVLGALAEQAVLVPTTTRTRAQYARVHLPGSAPRYAVTANGGEILVDGTPCEAWSGEVRARLATGSAPLEEVVQHLRTLAAAHPWVHRHRVAADLFTYLVVERSQVPAASVVDLTRWCADRGWTVSLQGRKVYCVPVSLTKSAAVAEVARRAGASRTLAAGDSLLDADLLAWADSAVRPAHGELHETLWTRPHVAVTDRAGVLGGEEVLARLLADVLNATSRRAAG